MDAGRAFHSSGAHTSLSVAQFSKTMENDQGQRLVFLGGIIPESDIPGLLAKGVTKVYGPGTDTRIVCQDIRAALADRA